MKPMLASIGFALHRHRAAMPGLHIARLLLAMLTGVGACLFGGHALGAAGRPAPNVVLILADDKY